jgi:hypothetical protein
MTKINEIFSLQTGTLCRKINNFAGERVKFGLDDGYIAHAHQRDVMSERYRRTQPFAHQHSFARRGLPPTQGRRAANH